MSIPVPGDAVVEQLADMGTASFRTQAVYGQASSLMIATRPPRYHSATHTLDFETQNLLMSGQLWVTLLVSYVDRVAIAVALPFMSADLHLTPSVAGLISGALLLSYTIVQVPAGYLADRFGQRRIIAAAIAWWTVFSVLTGVLS